MTQQSRADLGLDPALKAALHAAAIARGETVEALADRALRAWLSANGHLVGGETLATPTKAEEVR